MARLDLQETLDSLIAGWEGECVEFKEANDNYPTQDIGKYFSALANEANLRGVESAWLVFGVSNRRQVVGTSFRREPARLQGLKHQIAQETDPGTSFREIHELVTPEGHRVLLFEIPAAPRGIPIACKGHYFARNGESLSALSLAKQDEIRAQSIGEDWSSVICPAATLADLSPEAIAKAREIFTAKYSDRIPPETIRDWDDPTFLEKAALAVNGKLRRACLLLLGRPESAHHIGPAVAEMSWKLEGPELAYEHFGPPFLLATSLLYQRIRNIRLTLLPPGQMIPLELAKYDQRIVLEALHNCIAHQDYTRGERILVIERPTELVFQNAGGFFDGAPRDYVASNRTPTRYRNRALAQAMVHLRMIDTMGFGIRDVMFKGQARRFFPLPDYDLGDPGHVVLRIQGRFIDENYSRALLTHDDLPWPEILALDAIQKGVEPDEETLTALRRKGLIEGRKPALHVAASVAAATGDTAEYIRHRAFDDSYYCDLILKYLATFGQGRRADFERLLAGKLSDVLNDRQKSAKVHNLLQKMRRQGKILSEGRTLGGIWKAVPTASGEPTPPGSE
jgi:ATP-dependent DNA helicase RecG